MPNRAGVSEIVSRRRSAILLLAAEGKSVQEMTVALRDQGIVNPNTGKGFSRQTIRGDLKTVQHLAAQASTAPTEVQRVREMIGQWTLVKPLWQARIFLSKDTTWPDYIFWDALRKGRAPGYELASLFCMPIARTTTSYVFGDGFTVKLNESAIPKDAAKVNEMVVAEQDGKRTQDLKAAGAKSTTNHPTKTEQSGNGFRPVIAKPGGATGTPIDYTNLKLGQMVERNLALFIQTVIDMYGLADQYLFVNPDGTFSVASPETVTCEYSASDYRRLLRVVIRTKYESSTVTDIYTDDEREVRIHYYDGRADVVEHYANLIGRIPMVHFANERGPNEMHGHVLYEAALPLMSRYDNISFKTHDGVDLLGNPMPVFEGLDNPAETLALNSTEEQYVDEEGNTQTRQKLRVERDQAIVMGKGGSAKMLNPPVGFTKDSLDVQRSDFLLLGMHTHLPEFIFGGAVQASKANVEVQMPPFIRYIDYRRLLLQGEGADPSMGIEARGGFLALFDIWLRTMHLVNPAIVVGPVRISWPTIDAGDALVKFQWGSLLSSTAKITDEDAIAMSGYWKDPAAVVARAQGKKARQPQYDSYDERLQKSRLAAAQRAMQPDNDNGRPFSTDWLSINTDKMNGNGKIVTPPDERFSIIGPQVWEGEAGGPYGG